MVLCAHEGFLRNAVIMGNPVLLYGSTSAKNLWLFVADAHMTALDRGSLNTCFGGEGTFDDLIEGLKSAGLGFFTIPSVGAESLIRRVESGNYNLHSDAKLRYYPKPPTCPNCGKAVCIKPRRQEEKKMSSSVGQSHFLDEDTSEDGSDELAEIVWKIYQGRIGESRWNIYHAPTLNETRGRVSLVK